VARDIATALRGAVAETPKSYNRVLDQQLEAARGRGDELDMEALLRQVSAHYDRLDAERRGVVLSMQLMSDEAQALTREIREETASHLQAILDNIKDAIVTVDDVGHIETCNPTGERLFGYTAAEVLGRTLDFLLPDASVARTDDAGRVSLVEFLERCATKIDDTHVDLAAHQTWAPPRTGCGSRSRSRSARPA
jgi:PAS domain-containing protein